MREDVPHSKYVIVLFIVFGFAITVFGSILFVLPIIMASGLAHAGCGNNCIASIPSFNAYYLRALVTLILVVTAGFLPLDIFLVAKRK